MLGEFQNCYKTPIHPPSRCIPLLRFTFSVVVCMRMVSLSCTRLEINASFQEWELPGIVVLIKACPVVEDVRFVMNPKHEKVTMECDIL